ncbi:hypothetical protein AVEN_242726-1 [Araneus ventricosus]|uniref:Uncharacterized protein n=1 Tax=Araneus ventricosus TaxID=182803 RepID=A0A4Y2VWV9_ARAVE|nr:hypothetical protein AVEN_242726-1 [Araneus ventricosus]
MLSTKYNLPTYVLFPKPQTGDREEIRPHTSTLAMRRDGFVFREGDTWSTVLRCCLWSRSARARHRGHVLLSLPLSPSARRFTVSE